MSTEDVKKEKKCLFCKKTLLDKESVCCLRCLLEGRNKAATVSEVLVGAATIIGTAVAVDNTKNKK